MAGRAPSWIRTTRSASAPCRSSSATPAATDSWRRPPPATTAARAGIQAAARSSSTRSAAVTTTSRSMTAARRERVQRPGQQRTPADRRRDLVDPAHPRRFAPATTTTSAGGVGLREVNRGAAGRRSCGRPRSAGPGSRPRRDPCRCTARRPRRRSSCRRRGSRRPGPASLPSWMTRTRSSSPGSTAGFTAFASELMFSTRMPCSSATRFRLKSFVRMALLRAWARAISFASTSPISGTSSSTISTGVDDSFCIWARISRPRRPRLRRSVSELSAMCWSSSRTNFGTTSVP